MPPHLARTTDRARSPLRGSAQPGRPGVTAKIGRAAALIAVLTMASRVAGFVRTLVFARAVGDNNLGDVYVLANTIPNIVFEIVIGGAAAAMVVPLLARAVAAEDRAAGGRVMSALLTWVLAILVPIGLVVGLAAPLIVGLFATDKITPEGLDAAAGMLRIFAVQIPLYGIGIVFTGVLQAHRRFTWPALAPLLSSITVIGAYVLFALVDGARPGLAGASREGLAILAWGTTLGVVVLSGCLILPVRALRLPLRPTWSFDDPGQVRALALAGAVTVLAQQLTLMLALKLALAGPFGTATRFTLAQTVYLLPWAVLAVPMAVAAYPTLAQAHVTGDETGYRATLARTARTVAMLSCLGAALLIGVAAPAARFLLGAPKPGFPDGAHALAEGIAAFAPGLVGYGLAAVLTRALYARHRQREGAVATLTGWGVAAVAMLVLAWVMPDNLRLVAIGTGSSVGMLVLAAILILQNRPLPGLWRALLAGTVAGAAGAGAGLATVAATGGLPSSGRAIVVGVLAALATAAGFLVVALPLDAGDLRTMMSRVTGRLRRAGKGG